MIDFFVLPQLDWMKIVSEEIGELVFHFFFYPDQPAAEYRLSRWTCLVSASSRFKYPGSQKVSMLSEVLVPTKYCLEVW